MRPAFLTLLVVLAAAGPAQAAGLRAGAGRADITPPTGYYSFGWVRSDAVLRGQHTRLFARALVLERNGKKVALVAMDVGGVAGGAVKQAADLLKDRGFSEANVLVSASHTHASASGWFNFSTYNTVFMTMGTLTDFNVTGELDPQLYAFMVQRIAEAIRRADDDLAPAAAGWGQTEILGITQNRSLEAHLHNHGIDKPFGQGKVSDDPNGYAETIDPAVDVLRVDKVSKKRRIPIGMWSNFANHGTINKYTFGVYNADHHGTATRLTERALRRIGKVPAGQEVINAYGNGDEGDMSSGLTRSGPAEADAVGRVEAAAFLQAWRSAGKQMSRTPALDLRWTRVCFCGQEVEGGRVDSQGVTGLPLFTGSEEGRGPLYDTTGVPFEGRTSPIDDGAQGHKIPLSSGGPPVGAPLFAVRVGDRAIVSIPGEMTSGMGRRVRESVEKAGAGAGIRRAVIAGLANEYISYFTSPEEYDQQHYEGGSTMFGRVSSNLFKGGLTDLTARLADGRPAPEPYAFDPTNGIKPDGAPFPTGAASGQILDQPSGIVTRFDRARLRWQGGPWGQDRPLDAPFVRVERLAKKRWRAYTDDLGLQILWTVDDEAGHYEARFEPAWTTPRGTYRFVVTANHYRLESNPFSVGASPALSIAGVDRDGNGVTVELRYPVALENLDLLARPRAAAGGTIGYVVGGERRSARSRRGESFLLRARPGQEITIPPGAARDRFGNASSAGATLG